MGREKAIINSIITVIHRDFLVRVVRGDFQAPEVPVVPVVPWVRVVPWVLAQE